MKKDELTKRALELRAAIEVERATPDRPSAYERALWRDLEDVEAALKAEEKRT